MIFLERPISAAPSPEFSALLLVWIAAGASTLDPLDLRGALEAKGLPYRGRV